MYAYFADTWAGYVLIGVNGGATASASAALLDGAPSSNSGGSCSLDVTVRLTFADGQRVQLDL